MKRTLALLLITLTFVVFPIVTTEAEIFELQQLSEPLIQVQRNVTIENAGIMFLNDTFTLRAHPGSELLVSEFWTGFHESFINERRSFEVWQATGWTPVTYSEVSEGSFRGYGIVLPSPVTLRDGVDLRIRASYLFVNRVSSKADHYEARIPVYPALVYNISSFELHVELPTEAQFKDVSSILNFTDKISEETWVLDHESEEVVPFSNVDATISYVPSPDDEYLLDCERLERHIIIRQGGLRVEDSYTLMNTGSWINRFHLRLPSNASKVRARDGVGPIEVSTMEAAGETGYIDAYVVPRSSFRPYDKWGFTLSYTMPKGGYVNEEGGKSTLTYPMYGFPYYVRELSALVTLPEGGRFMASQPEPTSTRKIDSTTEVLIELGARLPSERPVIVVELAQSPIAPYIRPIAMLLIAAGAVGSVYILRRRRRVVEVKPVAVERPGLSDFLEQQRERISLLQELEDLQKELEDRRISRDRFDRRAAEINRRLKELARSLRQLGKDLEAEDPGLRGRLSEIRRAEQELEMMNTDLRNLDVRLRARRISRRDYERRREGRLKRRSQAIRRIEQALASLGRE